MNSLNIHRSVFDAIVYIRGQKPHVQQAVLDAALLIKAGLLDLENTEDVNRTVDRLVFLNREHGVEEVYTDELLED